MNKLYTFLAVLFISGTAFAQPYNFDGLTSGSVGTFTNGWVGSNTTGYSWRAQAGPTTSGGTGPEVDHTLGTATGIFMYVEASTPAAAGSTTDLTSPSMSITGIANPALSFWYHMVGAGMGTMYIDVFNGTSWVLNVDSLVGAQQVATTDPYLNKTVNLGAFSGSIQVRFRAVYGTNWDGDMAIDDVDLIDMPAYNASLDVMLMSHAYYMMPVSQVQPVTFKGVVSNVGADTINGVTVSGSISPPGFPLSGSVTQILPTVTDTVTITTTVTPNATGLYMGDFTVSITESDTILDNDSAHIQFEVTDTVMAREDGNITLGIGFNNATGIAGQVFEIFTQDSISSASFFLPSPSAAMNVKMKLYEWNDTANTPGTILDSTNMVTVASGSTTWNTVQFTCDRVLPVGKYFIAVEQLGTTNMGLGYTPAFFEEGTALFDGGGGWTTLSSVGFDVTLAIRANLGVVSFPTVSLGADTGFCDGSSVTLTAPTGWASYSWSNGNTGATTVVNTADSNFWLEVTNTRGCAIRDTIIVTEFPLPTVNLQPTVGVCNGASATLVANNDPTYNYLWNTGSTDSSITVSAAGLYAVTVTDLNGCSNTGFTSIVAGATPIADIGTDTINYCVGSFATVTAAGSGNLYQWSNGTTGATTQISTPGQVILTVTSPGSCVAYDTAWAVENPNPTVNLSTNSLNFCDNEMGALSVNTVTGATYLWSTGETTSSITTTVAGQYWVETTLNGCSASDTGMATVLASPIVDLGMDTSICDTATLVLDAGAGSAWTWSTGASTQTINVNTAGDYSVIVENTDGCEGGDTINVSVEVCVGIFEPGANNLSIDAYPNPVYNAVTLSLSAELINSTIKVLDSKGAIVFTGIVNSEIETIQVSEWTAGVYYVRIQNGTDVYTTKIVVQH